ncbi:MAG: DnaB-like helicase C-terminal domain-containing protein [Selenomonadaceae bacterium]|nr:DnaB-like helicase C-terminal domain-containing protein [Selenomonadaceae bacterium]
MNQQTTDKDVEQAVLSACLNANKADKSAIFSSLKAEDFFFPTYGKLFSLFRSMYLKCESVEPVRVMELHKAEIMSCGVELADYASIVPLFDQKRMSIENTFAHYVKVNEGGLIATMIDCMKELRRRRELVSMSARIKAYVEKGRSSEEIYQAVEKSLIVREDRANERTLITPRDMAEYMLDAVAERMDKEKRRQEVLYTSFRKLNKCTGGFEHGDLVILSAASGVGKSAFVANIARDVGIIQKRPVLYLNSEMSDKQQALRYASMLSGVSHKMIRDGLPDNTEGQGDKDYWGRVEQAAEKQVDGRLYTLTIPDLQIENAIAETRRIKERIDMDNEQQENGKSAFPLSLVIVDYVGRMDTLSNRDRRQEWQIMEQAARALKTMAQELNLVVIMVAQMSSNGETLAKASSMKNECDLWLNLRRLSNDEYAKVSKCWNVCIEIKKARNVETGKKLLMHFHGDTLTYTDKEDDAQAYSVMERGE